jgi:putative hydrolase of the HAD superfamily
VILPGREGVRKPSAFVCRRVPDAPGPTGPERVFVGDHAGNPPPAGALGIRTVRHTTDPEGTAARLDAPPERTAAVCPGSVAGSAAGSAVATEPGARR